ncbi:hypothetical protein FRC07_003442 [Ceratobasidium sp. 392]|nr:hypothetical protein FRC07_003442 [Ceratobasidium sp. 392]
MDGILKGSWIDWRCRECRGEGPEGVEYRLNAWGQPSSRISSQPLNPPPNSRPNPLPNPPPNQIQIRNQAQTTKRTVTPATVDLTQDSDSEPEIRIIDNPKAYHQSTVPPSNRPLAPQNEISLISPERTPPPEVVDEDSSTNEQSNNPLRYLPTPELQIPPTPELRYPSSDPDLGALRLETPARAACPVFPFQPAPAVRPLEPSNPPDRPRPKLLPPALRPSQKSILGEHLLSATTESRIIQIIGVRELKMNGWTLERREEEVDTKVQPRNTVNKGKGRAVGERTRDWTPLIQREEAIKAAERDHAMGPPPEVQKRSVFRLVPPAMQASQPAWAPTVHPPRQPRKRSAKPRDPTVKVEELELKLGL